MQNRNTLAAVGIIALGLLAFVLVYKIAIRTPMAPAPEGIRSVAPSPQTGMLQKTDEGGNTWVLTLASGQPFNGAADDAQAGPLVTVKADVQRRGANEAGIGLVLEGVGGERYKPVITKNGVRLPAPGLRIVDEQGEMLAEGKFQYG